jgi:tetratricopeptide (TPR) repeat protein
MGEHYTDKMPPPPAATGGYEFEVIELGPNLYFRPGIPIKSIGRLIPASEDDIAIERKAPSPKADKAFQYPGRVPKKDSLATLEPLVRRLQAATKHDAELEFGTLFYLGQTLYDAGRYIESVLILESSLSAAISLDSLSQLQSALLLLNNAHRGLGMINRATSMYENLLSSSVNHENPLIRMNVLYKYSELLAMYGRTEKSQAILNAARNVTDSDRDSILS